MTRREANRRALERLCSAEPVLVSVRPAIEVVPGMRKDLVLTSGPRLPVAEYSGGQWDAVVGGVLYEELRATREDAEQALLHGDVEVAGCQELNCVGSLAGVTTASMPVLVVEDAASGARAYCTLYEGDAADRLNYGTYTDATRENLEFLRTTIAPALDAMIQRRGEAIRLKPIIARALTMGDELHSRNTAATLLFLRELCGTLVASGDDHARELARYLAGGDYFFLRLSMASAKVTAGRMQGVTGSSLVTAMAFSCKEFAITVAGLGDTWFRGPLPTFEDLRLDDGYGEQDMQFMGGESVVAEAAGLGGVAQAAGLPLHRSSGRSADRMIGRTLQMYEICAGEHPDFRIPVLDYRGVPTGLDVESIVRRGITPVLDIGIAGRSGRQIGGGVARAPIEPFADALKALESAG